MSVKIKISCEDITKEQLFNIYNLYREAYKIKEKDEDKHYFFNEGIKLLNAGQAVDYRPFMGAKFFAQPFSYGVTEFWGYTRDYSQPKEESNFEKLLKDSFKVVKE